MSGLRRLTIENYGLVKRVEIEFARGATIFTGETGSGKTMVLGALAFVLGERASADELRRGAARAVVSLEFEPEEGLRGRLSADGFDVDAGESAVLSREITDAGKSSLRLNGRPTTAGYVRELASQIADFIGQHDAQRLLQPGYHVEILDRFGGPGNMERRANVARAHGRVRESDERRRAFEDETRHLQERIAFAIFALAEIDRDAPGAQEEAPLLERRRLLDNVEKISSALRAAHDALAGEERSAADQLGTAASSLRAVSEIGGELQQLADQAVALQSEASDLSVRIARALDAAESEPAQLEAINARLDVLDRLKRKYGGTLEAVLRSAEEFRQTVASVERRDERRLEIVRELDAGRADLQREARALSAARHAAAEALGARVAKEFAELALEGARFGVRFEELPEIEVGGRERIEFVFAANAGEPERELARVASGGELSRLLLAVVVASASGKAPTALVFDEIDTGIGGTTATAVGTRLGRLAAAGQVVLVTHLAQIASWADRHYILEKRAAERGAEIGARLVATQTERAAELARMLSGEAQEVAVRHARALLAQAEKQRATLS